MLCQCLALARHRLKVYGNAMVWLQLTDIRRASAGLVLDLAVWSGLSEGQ
jgi:hypothetical protein